MAMVNYRIASIGVQLLLATMRLPRQRPHRHLLPHLRQLRRDKLLLGCKRPHRRQPPHQWLAVSPNRVLKEAQELGVEIEFRRQEAKARLRDTPGLNPRLLAVQWGQ